MFQLNPLQKLYPHLNFNRVPAPTVSQAVSRSSSQPPTQTVKPTAPITQPEAIPQTDEVPMSSKPSVVRAKRVVVTEPAPTEAVTEPLTEHTKPKRQTGFFPRPNRAPPIVKPEPLLRGSKFPSKGEQGLQSQYSFDQRKDMFLERLSHKSVKRAEIEIGKINDVLAEVDYDPTKLKTVEQQAKTRLKLINHAKFFTATSKADTANEPLVAVTAVVATATDINEQPPSTDKRDTPSTDTSRARDTRTRGNASSQRLGADGKDRRGRGRRDPTPPSESEGGSATASGSESE